MGWGRWKSQNSFVPELRSVFCVSGFLCSMYICYEHSMYVSGISLSWVWYTYSCFSSFFLVIFVLLMLVLHVIRIQVAILFLVERHKILLLSNKAALNLDSVNFPLFKCDLVTSDWLISCFYFSHLSLANLLLLLMGMSINICWQFLAGQHL